jgi:hypothetical protein
MIKTFVSPRLTHRYVGTCKHLDRWSFKAFRVTFTPERLVDRGNRFDDYGATIRWATLPAGVDRALVERAIVETLSREGCHHDYDCCGCLSYRVRVLHRKGRRLVLKTTYSRNY